MMNEIRRLRKTSSDISKWTVICIPGKNIDLIEHCLKRLSQHILICWRQTGKFRPYHMRLMYD